MNESNLTTWESGGDKSDGGNPEHQGISAGERNECS